MVILGSVIGYPASTMLAGATCAAFGLVLLISSTRLAAWAEKHSVRPSFRENHERRQARLAGNLAVTAILLVIFGVVIVISGVHAALAK